MTSKRWQVSAISAFSVKICCTCVPVVLPLLYQRPEKPTPGRCVSALKTRHFSRSRGVNDKGRWYKTTPPRAQPARQSITFELVTRLAPHQGLTDNLVRTFGLDPVDYDGIRDTTGEHITRAAKAFGTALNERALQIHLQRVTGAFVSSAFGAAQFYGIKKS